MVAKLDSYRLIVRLIIKAKFVLHSDITVVVATRILRRLLDAKMQSFFVRLIEANNLSYIYSGLEVSLVHRIGYQKASLLHQQFMRWIEIHYQIVIKTKTLLLCWLVLHPMEFTFIITLEGLRHEFLWLQLTPSTPPILHWFVFITWCNLYL